MSSAEKLLAAAGTVNTTATSSRELVLDRAGFLLDCPDQVLSSLERGRGAVGNPVILRLLCVIDDLG